VAEGISHNKDVIGCEPFHPCVCIQCGLFNLVDHIAAEEMAADSDEIWSLGLVVHVEILLEVSFFDREEVMGSYHPPAI